ncbi:MAG: hypothetical protein ACRCXZ_00915 [Patescibacteria group bacterium]
MSTSKYRVISESGRNYLVKSVGTVLQNSVQPKDQWAYQLTGKIQAKTRQNFVLITPEIIDHKSYVEISERVSRHADNTIVQLVEESSSGYPYTTIAVIYTENADPNPKSRYLDYIVNDEVFVDRFYWTFNEACQLCYYGPLPTVDKIPMPNFKNCKVNVNGQVILPELVSKYMPAVIPAGPLPQRPITQLAPLPTIEPLTIPAPVIVEQPVNPVVRYDDRIPPHLRPNGSNPQANPNPQPATPIKGVPYRTSDQGTVIVSPAAPSEDVGGTQVVAPLRRQPRNITSPQTTTGSGESEGKSNPWMWGFVATIAVVIFGTLGWAVANGNSNKDGLNEARDKVGQLEGQTKAQGDTIKDLKASVDSLKTKNAELDALNREITILNDQVKELKEVKRKDAPSQEESTKIIQRRADLQQDLSKLQSEVDTQAQKTREYIAQNAPSKSDLAELSKDLDTQTKKIQDAISDGQSQIKSIDKGFKDMSKKFDDFKASWDAAQPQIQEIKEKADKVGQQVSDAFNDLIKVIEGKEEKK